MLSGVQNAARGMAAVRLWLSDVCEELAFTDKLFKARFLISSKLGEDSEGISRKLLKVWASSSIG